MVLGHLTVTAAGRRLLAPRLRCVAVLPVRFLILGAYLPDLLDKSMNRPFGLPSRAFGHSLVVESLAFGLLALLLPRRRLLVGTMALGVGLHLLEDWVDLRILLAPLLGPIPPAPHWSLLESLIRFYSSGGPQVAVEIAALLYWILVGLRRVWPVTTSPSEEPDAASL